LDYVEVETLAEILDRYRDKAREAVQQLRDWKRRYAAEANDIEKLYLSYEGMFLRDHVRDTLRLYRLVAHDFHDAYASQMNAGRMPAGAMGPRSMPRVSSRAKKLQGGKNRHAA